MIISWDDDDGGDDDGGDDDGGGGGDDDYHDDYDDIDDDGGDDAVFWNLKHSSMGIGVCQPCVLPVRLLSAHLHQMNL